MLGSGGTSQFGFAEPVTVNSWSWTGGAVSGTTNFNLEYLNASNQWVVLFSQSTMETTAQTRQHTFGTVTAREFRIRNGSALGNLSIVNSRLGFGGVYPGFLPHVGLNQTLTMTVGAVSSSTITVANVVGTANVEVTPATWNGLTFNTDGTVTGTPTVISAAPGFTLPVRVQDSRGVWSNSTTMRVIVQSDSTASTQYPNAGVWEPLYTNSGESISLAPGQSRQFSFAEPVFVNSWRYRAASSGSVNFILEYQDTNNQWVALSNTSLSTATINDYTRSFTGVTASSFRIRNSNGSGSNQWIVYNSRLGSSSVYPAFLPHVTSAQTLSATVSTAYNGSLVPTTFNTVGLVEYEFTPSTTNGLTFNANGTITGTPSSIVAGPGTEIAVRIRDDRGLWSQSQTFRMVSNSNVSATNTYPVFDAVSTDIYTDDTSFVTVNSSNTRLITFASPVTVSSWQGNMASSSGTSALLRLEYLDATSSWVELQTASTSSTSPVLFSRTFPTVTGTQFRLRNTSGTNTSNVFDSRLGMGGSYPAYLPHVASGQTFTFTRNQAVSANLSSITNDRSGSAEYEFIPSSLNGMTFNTDGTISGTPTSVYSMPGQVVNVRVRDDRGVWSVQTPITVFVNSSLSASSVYPQMNANTTDLYSNDGTSYLTLGTNASVNITFDEPVLVSQWYSVVATESGQTAALNLQYRNQLGNWVTANQAFPSDSLPSGAILNRTFPGISATEFRIVNASSIYDVYLFESRLSNGSLIPLLPHVQPTAFTAQQGAAFSGALTAAQVVNETGSLTYEFTPSTWNGLTFSSDGTIGGTPTSAAPQPGQSISVRVQDSRGIWSVSSSISVSVNASTLASASYPTSGTGWDSFYRNAGGTLTMAPGTNRTISFAQPVFVNSITTSFGLSSASATIFVVEYQNANNQWVVFDTIIRNSGTGTAQQVVNRTISGVTAQNFRVRHTNGSPSVIFGNFRLGNSGSFPAFLP